MLCLVLAHFPLRLGRCQLQIPKFPHMHLVAGGWYLDCSCGFVPEVEAMLYNTLVSSTPEVTELEEEPQKDNPAPQSNDGKLRNEA